MSIFTPPPETEWNVLSLGAGVQSSALALMAAHGEIGTYVDFAVFADTQAEPTEVYEWLETLQKLINEAPCPFPIYTVTKGNLTDAQLQIRTSLGKGTKPRGETYIKKLIPFFGRKPSGETVGAIGRSCTEDYKILPIRKFLREQCGIKRGQKNANITQWIGISWDEIQRARDSRVPWIQHRWPLLETRTSRADCINWMRQKGYPTPPRSACYYCPFHSDSEWRRLRDNDPEHFAKAVKLDHELRRKIKQHDKFMQMEVYIHNSCKPLDEVDFDNDEDKGQMTWDFQSECEGMCGV